VIGTGHFERKISSQGKAADSAGLSYFQSRAKIGTDDIHSSLSLCHYASMKKRKFAGLRKCSEFLLMAVNPVKLTGEDSGL
jgi:hypothetical protein